MEVELIEKYTTWIETDHSKSPSDTEYKSASPIGTFIPQFVFKFDKISTRAVKIQLEIVEFFQIKSNLRRTGNCKFVENNVLICCNKVVNKQNHCPYVSSVWLSSILFTIK